MGGGRWTSCLAGGGLRRQVVDRAPRRARRAAAARRRRRRDRERRRGGEVGGIFTAARALDDGRLRPDKDASSDAIIAALDKAGGWGGGRLQIDFSIPLFFADSSTPRRTINGPAPGGYSYCYGGTDCDPVPFQMPIPANGNAEGSSNYTCDTVQHRRAGGLPHPGGGDQPAEALRALQRHGGRQRHRRAGGDHLGSDEGLPRQRARRSVHLGRRRRVPDRRAAPHRRRGGGRGGQPRAPLHPPESVHAECSRTFTRPRTPASPSSKDPNAPPYGVRFRLKASFDDSAYNAGEKVIIAAMKKYGMLLSDGGTIPLTFADDRTTTAKWSDAGRHRAVVLGDHAPTTSRWSTSARRLSRRTTASATRSGRGRVAMADIESDALGGVGDRRRRRCSRLGTRDGVQLQRTRRPRPGLRWRRWHSAAEQSTCPASSAPRPSRPRSSATSGAGRFGQAYGASPPPIAPPSRSPRFTGAVQAVADPGGARQVDAAPAADADRRRRGRARRRTGFSTRPPAPFRDELRLPAGRATPRSFVVSLAGVPVLQGVAPAR